MELHTDKSGMSEITCFIRIHAGPCHCSGSNLPACHCGRIQWRANPCGHLGICGGQNGAETSTTCCRNNRKV